MWGGGGGEIGAIPNVGDVCHVQCEGLKTANISKLQNPRKGRKLLNTWPPWYTVGFSSRHAYITPTCLAHTFIDISVSLHAGLLALGLNLLLELLDLVVQTLLGLVLDLRGERSEEAKGRRMFTRWSGERQQQLLTYYRLVS